MPHGSDIVVALGLALTLAPTACDDKSNHRGAEGEDAKGKGAKADGAAEAARPPGGSPAVG